LLKAGNVEDANVFGAMTIQKIPDDVLNMVGLE
jgi:hypothetical protein